MARAETQEPRSDGESPPPMGHNGPSDEVVLAELAKVNAAWRERLKAKEEYQSQNAIYRRCIQDAKARGLNPDAIRDAIHNLEQDPEDVTQRLRDQIRYSGLLGMPLGSQGEIFADQNMGSPADLGREKVAGRKRVGARSMEKANPYPKGSWQAREFERGWIEGARAP